MAQSEKEKRPSVAMGGQSMIAAAYERTLESLHEEEHEESISSGINFTLHVHEIAGLKPVYPVSDIVLTVRFGEDVLFQSERTQTTETISIEQQIVLPLDIDDADQVNKFVTTPLVFTLIEYENHAPDEEIIESGRQGQILWRSEESVMDLEEALFGLKKSPRSGSTGKGSSQKSVGKSKSKGSRSSQDTKGKGGKKGGSKSKSDVDMKDIAAQKPYGPQVAGSASIDLVTLFSGSTEIVECLVLKAPAGQALDDRMKAAANLPTLQVEVVLNKPIPKGNIFYYTIESVYNLPKVMSNTMMYQLVVGIPTNMKVRLVPYLNYAFAEAPSEPFRFKKYYGSGTDSNFVMRDDFENVKCNLPMDFAEALPFDFPRLEFNVIKGEHVSDEDIDAFRINIIKHRCIGLELYMINPAIMRNAGPGGGKSASGKNEEKKSKASKAGGSKKGKGSASGDAKDAKDEEYLHLMGFIDVCRLLCPGEQTTRVACELRTFNMDEFEQTCGLKDSYFRPKPPPPPPPQAVQVKPAKEGKAGKGGKGKGGKGKGSKDKSSKSSKSSKGGKKGKGQGDLRTKLPPVPAPPPPSVPVYNERGLPTFIIIEFEFRDPVVPTHDVDDLHKDLQEIIQRQTASKEVPRVFKSKYVTKKVFQDTVRVVAQTLKLKYLEFTEKTGKKEDLQGFLKFLSTHEEYQTCITTLTKSAAMYCNVATKFEAHCAPDVYHAYIGETYVQLVELLNAALTEVNLADTQSAHAERNTDEDLLFYAHEATEVGAVGLAMRYHLQRIANAETKPEYWLDYAVFKLQTGEPEAAQECAMEALAHNAQHRESLLFFACLLARKGRLAEAETCLLNVTISNPKWMEGWMALYCIYARMKNYEGMELCKEMALRYYKADKMVDCTCEDLGWTARQLPASYLFRAIIYLISMRLLEEAEVLLAEELFRRQTDTIEYLLGVIDMYKGNYEHAMDHIDTAFRLGSCSYEKNALRGHIFLLQQKHDCAIVEYEQIIKSTADIPYDNSIYMVYIKAGLCYSALGLHQKARAIILKACEKQGTPYSWLTTGILYYIQHDNLSAEECLTISNTLDNIMPETWAYLTLVNIKLGRPNEASNCYHQALDHKLQNVELLKLIDEELKEWEKEFTSSETNNTSK